MSNSQIFCEELNMWVDFTKHSLDREQQRQFTDSQIMEVLKYGRRRPGTYRREMFKRSYRGIVVVARQRQRKLVVITVYHKDTDNFHQAA